MIFAVGVGVGLGLSLSNDADEFNISDEMLKTSPEYDNVSVGYSIDFGPFDTEQGSLELADYSTVFDDDIVFPLCVDPSFFEDWWVVIRSTGGYHPCWYHDYDTQSFDLYQKGDIVTAPGYYIGYGLKWTDVTCEYKQADECCSVRYWKVEVDTSCGNLGCLDSNKYPDVSGISGLSIDWQAYNPDGCSIPDKGVMIEIMSTWAGCANKNQHFDLILAHKNHVLKIPNSQKEFEFLCQKV